MKKRRMILSLFLCISLLLSVVGCTDKTDSSQSPSTEKTIYKAGTYTGVGKGNNGPVKVEVVFSEDQITSVEVKENSETPGIFEKAAERVPADIVAHQSLAVDAVTGASVVSNAIIEAVADAVQQAGGDTVALKAVAITKQEGKAEEITVDVVVVGAGAAGTAAALASLEQGADTLLIEKTAVASGAGTLAGGMFAVDSTQQKEQNKVVDKEWLFKKFMETSNYHANARLVRKIMDESGETVDWMNENGAKLVLTDPGQSGQKALVGTPATIHGYVDGGSVALEKIRNQIETKGGKIMFETPAEQLIKDDKGNVTGVIAKKADGGELKIHAKSVILATGGYGGNAEMMKEHFGEKAGTGLISSATGDGLKMAWEAGAAELGTDLAQWYHYMPNPELSKKMENPYVLWDLTALPLLWVNKNGERYINEDIVFDFAYGSSAIYEQPDASHWALFDQLLIETVKTKGLIEYADLYSSFKGKKQGFVEFNEPFDTDTNYKSTITPFDYTPIIEEAIESGVIVKGETIAELASKIGVSEQTLNATVDRYNGFSQKGVDEDFFKDAEYLNPVKKGPFYALSTSARCLGTLGGVKINENIQAVNDQSKPIPGLWVAGNDAGGMYGNSYITIEGGTLGFAYTSGKLAGENAAEYAKKQ
ncbi:FAD-dependent oxidoreductase [Paenibacillus sp. FSL K6-0276]|uniref:FAD-dependent oxidoreductase n=1 Tax=Paenibacillus sp. FSL K6-0276 TaxID=2921450 RepID=UPI0030EE9022